MVVDHSLLQELKEEASKAPTPLPSHLSTHSYLLTPDSSGITTPQVPNHSINKGVSSLSLSSNFHILHDNSSGYVAEPFPGKVAQMENVIDNLEAKGFIPPHLIENEVQWFYNNLGIDDSYFATENVENIASHVLSLYGAKVVAFARNDHKLDIRLDREDEDHAVYIDTSVPGVSNLTGIQYEQRIEDKYLDRSTKQSFRIETFRSVSHTDLSAILSNNVNLKEQIRCYFVYANKFPNESVAANETDMSKISDINFYKKASDNTKNLYLNMIKKVINQTGPVIELYQIEGSLEKRVIIAYRRGSVSGFFSAFSHLYHYYGLTSTRKYVEQFVNGITVMSIYLIPLPVKTNQFPPIENSIHQVVREASLLFCLPKPLFNTYFVKGDLSVQEASYAHAACIFVQHFLNRLGSEYASLYAVLDKSNPAHQEVLNTIKVRLRSETFTREYIFDIISSQLEVIRNLYLQFADVHYVQLEGEVDSFLPTLSYQRMKANKILSDKEMDELIIENSPNEHHVYVLKAIQMFNKHLLKTNFYTPTKVALSFRLDPSFLPPTEYPQPLFGMFLVVGHEFRGFHLRFQDVARGGIRIVKSRNREAYSINSRSLFDENYNLANTQQRKNKDIPEGGSKGVVLLNFDQQNKSVIAFQKYIDSIIDLLLPGIAPGIKEPIVDLYGKPEILFMGPDENTAELVNWATLHARARNAPWWKSFFTGKAASLGGIPHDKYGMTSLSVRAYVNGIYKKLDVDQKTVTKMQTGGPDGDLGSNEILLSGEKYVAIVDGSGVLADPEGLDRDELLRLAHARQMISNYNVKLSPSGFKILVDDKNVTLPSGEIVHEGAQFRNTYHLRGNAQIFVPCGGRPEAININNVHSLINEDGKSRIPWIVEGANLFITQDAKLRLEKAGAIIFKDASANKGGVTSSSLEVLASLALSDDEFLENMCVTDKNHPKFYDDYVKEVQATIVRNATEEFEALWREGKKTGRPRAILSDELSVAINDLNLELQQSNLWEDEQFRNAVLKTSLPKKLLDFVGLEKILQRVPEAYMKAIFGSHLAANFVYKYGPSPGQFSFFEYMSETRKELLG